jgi:phage recombination protein Bet
MAKSTKKDKVSAEETSLVKQKFTEMADIKRSLSKDQLEVIKKTIAPSLNDSELMVFLYRANKVQLDPLAGEIFAYTAFDKASKTRKLVIITARDGKRVVAERSGRLAFINTEAIYRRQKFTEDGKPDGFVKVEPWEGGELWGATSTVSRKDRVEPVSVTVALAEYKMSRAVWQSKPETMIKKVAESQALSAAFPELSGIYDEAEQWDASNGQEKPTDLDDNDPPSTQQLEALKNLEVEIPEGITKGQAKELLNAAIKGGK